MCSYVFALENSPVVICTCVAAENMASRILGAIGKLGVGLALAGGVVQAAIYNGERQEDCSEIGCLKQASNLRLDTPHPAKNLSQEPSRTLFFYKMTEILFGNLLCFSLDQCLESAGCLTPVALFRQLACENGVGTNTGRPGPPRVSLYKGKSLFLKHVCRVPWMNRTAVKKVLGFHARVDRR